MFQVQWVEIVSHFAGQSWHYLMKECINEFMAVSFSVKGISGGPDKNLCSRM